MNDWLIIALVAVLALTVTIVITLLIARRLGAVADRDYPIAKRRSDFATIMRDTGDEPDRPHPQRRRTD